jgi:predicted restriction endonuclease
LQFWTSPIRDYFRRNKIYLDGLLIRLFEENYIKFAGGGDRCQPGPPFFHLRSASFWHHKIIPGRNKEYAKLKTSGGGLKRISDNIEYAYLDEAAFQQVANTEIRIGLRELIEALLKGE